MRKLEIIVGTTDNDKNHSLETNMEERLSLLTLIADTDLNLNSLNAGFSQLL